jgi:hypothetical protein
MYRMLDVPEGGQPGIDKKKNTATKQQDEQGSTPDQVTEINNILSESFQKAGVGWLKIINNILVACISFSCYL